MIPMTRIRIGRMPLKGTCMHEYSLTILTSLARISDPLTKAALSLMFERVMVDSPGRKSRLFLL